MLYRSTFPATAYCSQLFAGSHDFLSLQSTSPSHYSKVDTHRQETCPAAKTGTNQTLQTSISLQRPCLVFPWDSSPPSNSTTALSQGNQEHCPINGPNLTAENREGTQIQTRICNVAGTPIRHLPRNLQAVILSTSDPRASLARKLTSRYVCHLPRDHPLLHRARPASQSRA